MRVAFVGKGGAGKSLIAGTFARLLGREGVPVLAVDSDPLPGLSLSLGLGVVETAIPAEAIEERAGEEPGPRYRLRAGLSAEEAVLRYAVPAPDGVRLLQLGKQRGRGGGVAGSHFVFRQILDGLPADTWTLVGDLPGGTRQPFYGWARYASTVLVVVEPTAKSLLSARRLARLALFERPPERIVVVANKVRDPAEVDLIARRTGLEVLAAVPWDEALRDAERSGVAPLDTAPRAPAIRVIQSLTESLHQDVLECAR